MVYFEWLGIYLADHLYHVAILNMLLPIHIQVLYFMNNFDLLSSYMLSLYLYRIDLVRS